MITLNRFGCSCLHYVWWLNWHKTTLIGRRILWYAKCVPLLFFFFYTCEPVCKAVKGHVRTQSLMANNGECLSYCTIIGSQGLVYVNYRIIGLGMHALSLQRFSHFLKCLWIAYGFLYNSAFSSVFDMIGHIFMADVRQYYMCFNNREFDRASDPMRVSLYVVLIGSISQKTIETCLKKDGNGGYG